MNPLSQITSSRALIFLVSYLSLTTCSNMRTMQHYMIVLVFSVELLFISSQCMPLQRYSVSYNTSEIQLFLLNNINSLPN
ncbi:hypothetical protein Ccrd_016163 [Cynara cardunculus var. scolymus]|uniref:Uncharacterized protein n=1 Tax=Cynara cardunculus var. scolymus TaxID=59895 RepID=A0A124SG75_CYNCS|nr:hypothetical protein Ccrd_016163 [Cynara cardunculus var. scolymus]